MLANKNIITKKKSLEKFEDKVEKILQTAEKQKWKERSRRRETKSGPLKVQYWWIRVGENHGGENQRKNIRKSLVLKGMSDQHKKGTKIQSKQNYGISEHQRWNRKSNTFWESKQEVTCKGSEIDKNGLLNRKFKK